VSSTCHTSACRCFACICSKSSDLLDFYLSPAAAGDEPTPYTALLNGVVQGYCEVTGATGCGYAYVKGVASSCDDPKTQLRLINAGTFAMFNISVDNHRWVAAHVSKAAKCACKPPCS
jgi:hypothetical protein